MADQLGGAGSCAFSDVAGVTSFSTADLMTSFGLTAEEDAATREGDVYIVPGFGAHFDGDTDRVSLLTGTNYVSPDTHPVPCLAHQATPVWCLIRVYVAARPRTTPRTASQLATGSPRKSATLSKTAVSNTDANPVVAVGTGAIRQLLTPACPPLSAPV